MNSLSFNFFQEQQNNLSFLRLFNSVVLNYSSNAAAD